MGGRNFGCGSSREHAAWALKDFGVRAVISTEIADIFHSNALKNGMLPVVVDQETWDLLARPIPIRTVTVDLEKGELRFGNHVAGAFTVEPFARECLLHGVDTLGWLLESVPAIEAFETARGPMTYTIVTLPGDGVGPEVTPCRAHRARCRRGAIRHRAWPMTST